MKIAIRIFNLVIMAISLLATVFLFVSPTLTFKAKVCIDVPSLTTFVPSTPYTEDLDIVALLGTDEVQAGVQFNLTAADTSKILDGDRDFINEHLLGTNIEDLIDIVHEPVNLITEYYVRTFIKGLIKDEIRTEVEKARQKYGDTGSTADEIMQEVGMDDDYFDNLTFNLYRAADTDGATLDSVTQVLFDEIDEALQSAEYSGVVDTTSYSEESKNQIRGDVESNFSAMKLINDDGTLKRISMLAFSYLSDYLVNELTGKVDAAQLVKQADEDDYLFSSRLVRLYVYNMIPDDVYNIMGYVALALFVTMFVFAATWIVLFVITLIRTLFMKKPWTIFGPWFWLIGSLQVFLGYTLTYLGKVALPKLDLATLAATFNLPIKNLLISPRTFALVPSILYLVITVIAIAYGFIKRRVRRQIREEDIARQEEDDEEE